MASARPSLRAVGLGVAATLLLAAAGTASGRASHDDAAARWEAEPDRVQPLRLTPEMSRYLRENLRIDQPRASLLASLIDLVFSPQGLGVTYGNRRTLTAAETFENRGGNCLSFTMMFVAMARHLGFAAYFVEVDEVTSWDQRGTAVVNNKHMYAEIELHNGVYRIDFLPGVEKRYMMRRRIDETRVRAHYFNNVGAELLGDGRPEEAISWLERAIDLDGTFSAAWTNLGVAQRRLGRLEAAEASLRRAFAVDDRADAARSNLARLYLATGRIDDAAPLLADVARHHDQNPYHHLRLALAALARDDPRAAVQHLRAAIRRRGDEPVFHLEMAIALHRLGDAGAAASFAHALALSDDPREESRWRERWREETAGPAELDPNGRDDAVSGG